MVNRYSNQNHAVHRSSAGMPKTASIYDKQAVSNRAAEETKLSFSSLVPSEQEAILYTMQREAKELESDGLSKQALQFASPFDQMRIAKNLIQKKLGIGDESAHDLASGVVARAQDLHQSVGGEIEPLIGGIIDHMNPEDIQQRIGAVPMQPSGTQNVEESVKTRLIEELQLSAFQSDTITKSVMQQVRNLSTRFRSSSSEQIAHAVIDVMVNHQDTSVVYNMSSSDRMLEEIRNQLQQG